VQEILAQTLEAGDRDPSASNHNQQCKEILHSILITQVEQSQSLSRVGQLFRLFASEGKLWVILMNFE
jgi:hypothetical protein